MNNYRQALYQPLETDPEFLNLLLTHRQVYEAISAALTLKLFKHLENAKTVQELSDQLNVSERVLSHLLKLFVQIDCVRETGGKFIATPMAKLYLNEDSYLYLGHEFILDGSYGNQLLEVLTDKNFAPMHPQPKFKWDTERLRQIGVFGLTGSLQGTVAAADLTEAGRLLDLGGGHGFYSIAFAQKYPHLNVTLFDLPHIVTLAEHFVELFSLKERIDFMDGDFYVDSIGSGYDAILCANIMSSEKRDILLSKVYSALNEGGQLILKTRISQVPENLDNAASMLFWQVRGGKELFSFGDWRGFLGQHNFHNVKMTGLSGVFATIVAAKGE